MNRHGANSNNKLGEKNISQSRKGFDVSVKVDGIRVYRKFFKTIEEARTARDKAVEKYHGDNSSFWPISKNNAEVVK
jgi:hypothetical protein